MPGPLGTTPATQSIAFEGEGGGGAPPSNAVYVSGTTWVITGNTWITGDTTVANQVKFNIVNSSIGTTQIENDSITYAKIQNVTDARLLGRAAGSAGDIQEITAGANISISGGSISATVGAGSGISLGLAEATTRGMNLV